MCGLVGLMCAIVAQGAIVRDGGTEEAKTYSVEQAKAYKAAEERAAETTTEQAKDSDLASEQSPKPKTELTAQVPADARSGGLAELAADTLDAASAAGSNAPLDDLWAKAAQRGPPKLASKSRSAPAILVANHSASACAGLSCDECTTKQNCKWCPFTSEALVKAGRLHGKCQEASFDAKFPKLPNFNTNSCEDIDSLPTDELTFEMHEHYGAHAVNHAVKTLKMERYPAKYITNSGIGTFWKQGPKIPMLYGVKVATCETHLYKGKHKEPIGTIGQR